MPLEELDFSFMPLSAFAGREGSQIAPLARFRMLLAGIETVLS
jgi:hypothetical protein